MQNVYLCRVYTDLQINTSDEIIFINSKEKGAAEKWYEKIVQEKTECTLDFKNGGIIMS